MNNSLKGLSDNEVIESRQRYGTNFIKEAEPLSFWQHFLEGFQDPTIKILCVISVIMLIMYYFGYSDWYEPVGTIIAVILVNFVTAKTGTDNDKAYKNLKDSQKKDTAKIIRNGKLNEIVVDDIVVGDIILLQNGDKILADGILVDGKISVDNSSLNGEAEECKKTAAPEGYELIKEITGDTFVDKHSLFRNSVVINGEGYMEVKAVGEKTMAGKMAEDMKEKEPDSPLQVKLSKLAHQISNFGYVGSIVIALAYLAHYIVLAGGISAYLNNDLGTILVGIVNAIAIAITIIVCAVPEGLPLVIALVLMQNTGKLYKANVLVRKAIGIETAGSLNILFSDKTGTITKGKLEVVKVLDGNGNNIELNKTGYVLKNLYKSIANNSASEFDANGNVIGGNMTDKALLNFINNNEYQKNKLNVINKQEFNSTNKFSQISYMENSQLITEYKGAPEVLLAHAKKYMTNDGKILPLNLDKLNAKIDDLANNAMRVLCFGYSKQPLKENIINDDTIITSLVAIRDDVRPEAKEAIKEVQNAGIQVVMITGDRKETAVAIAKDAGLYCEQNSDIALTSKELNNMSDNEIKQILPKLKVIARALPTDKSRMVKICQSVNLVVGMTGDGTNDAPALKAADVGFAMGSGTDVAKEASKLVILDDNFNSIKNAIWYGRTLYNNILKFCKMQLTINVAAVIVSAICPFIGIEAPLKVTHLLWINLCMDALASLMFAGEPALRKYMKAKPRKRDENIISKEMATQIGVMGVWLTLISILWFKLPFVATFFNTENEFYTGFFCMFVFAFMVNAFNVRAKSLNVFEHIKENPAFIKIWSLIMIIQIVLVSIGGIVGEIFSCTSFNLSGWIMVTLFALTMYPVDMIRKLLFNK